jgi:lactate 2-monooxygenase
VEKQLLFVEKEGAIATIVLNRPEKRNALNLAMWVTLSQLLNQLEEDPETKVVVIRGVDVFSAGADISEFVSNRSSAEKAKTYNDQSMNAVDRLHRFPKPTIAMIQKYAVGGGLDIALSCDFRFTSEDGIFAITPAKLGIVYNLTSTKRLVDLVGPSKTKEILYTARSLDAHEAYRFGLVDRIYSKDEIAKKTYEFARLLAERSQVSIRGTKKMVQAILDGATEESPPLAQMVLDSFDSDDYREGVQAYLEKRKPQFSQGKEESKMVGEERREETALFTKISKETQSLPISIEDWEQQARAVLPDGPFDFICGGSGAEETLAANRSAFQRWAIVPRVLRDVSERTLNITLFNHQLKTPILLAPVGMQGIAHPDGELATARAAAAAGVPLVVSTVSTYSLEQIAETMGDAPRWFQLYWSNDREVSASMVRRAEAAGYSAIVLTVDRIMLGLKRQDFRNGYSPFNEGKGLANYINDPVFCSRLTEVNNETAVQEILRIIDHPALSWEDIRFLRKQTNLPILVKGILHPEDAKLAVEHGADGIIVSNHGGRQLDGAISSLDALPPIAEAVGGRIPLLLDSGIRTGADIVKALALGANAVLIGRPFVYGLAVAGEKGVARVIDTLISELDVSLALSGSKSVQDLNHSILTRL